MRKDINMGRPMFGDSPMPQVTYRGRTYIWNRFWGYFVLPAGRQRKKERIIKEGCPLFDKLRQLAGYP